MKNVNLYKDYHAAHPNYGKSFNLHFGYIAAILNFLDCNSVIDFGCGKNVIADRLKEFGIEHAAKFDPAIPGLDHIPKGSFDCLINTDVLEHIPEAELAALLSAFKELSSRAIIIPHLEKASAVLANGENAHCTLKSPDEWKQLLSNYYQFVEHLPHHSKSHAMFLCADTEFNSSRFKHLMQVVLYLRTQYTVKEFAQTNTLRKRASLAFRLLRGKKGFAKKQY